MSIVPSKTYILFQDEPNIVASFSKSKEGV